MIDWKTYPKVDACYAETDGLVLTARPQGQWSVHDTKRRFPAVGSNLMGLMDGTMETAKENAAMAANEMLTKTNQ